MTKVNEKFKMRFNEKRILFTAKCYKTEKYIYKKKIEAFDYAIFLNGLTNLYIKAKDHEKKLVNYSQFKEHFLIKEN